jgi:Lrp/AsnC family transcriptional regulator, leucine-responsive regulatory protein
MDYAPKSPIELDEKDKEIIRALQANSKLSVREIGIKVKLSSTPTHERIKRLERNGVIKSYTALLEPRAIRKNIMVLCHVSLKDHDKKTAEVFINTIKTFDEVTECYNISGEFDFMLKIYSESMDSFHRFFVNQLCEIKGIGQTKSSFVMNVIKETHLLIEPKKP